MFDFLLPNLTSMGHAEACSYEINFVCRIASDTHKSRHPHFSVMLAIWDRSAKNKYKGSRYFIYYPIHENNYNEFMADGKNAITLVSA